MNRWRFLGLASLLIVGGLAYSMRPRPVASSSAPLMVYCAASNRGVMERIRQDYWAEFQIPVQVQYGPSQTLLSSLEVTRSGDLFLPADDSYLSRAREEGVVEEILPIAEMTAVVAVPRGNPRKLTTLSDLLRDGVRLVQASPEATAVGKLTRQQLQGQSLWEQVDSATTAYRTTVTDVANDVKVGAADAGIVFDAVLHEFPDLQSVSLPELASARARVAVGVVAATTQPARALHFARYLAARDRGLRRYVEHGFRPVEGDEWADVPELTLYAGSMLRPAIDETLNEFERREGVRVNRVYNGCGILVAQMKSGQQPDAYFACDTEFMNQVRDLFPDPWNVSENELVILVPKGNPRNLAGLSDLTRPGLRVGIGHEKQCAMGWLTQRTLQEGGLREEVMANVTVQTPTGDMLVNQLRAGSLDAAVAYLSNAAGSAEFLDAIRIRDIACSLATQPLAVARESRHRWLAERLCDCLETSKSRQRFVNEGFRWRRELPNQARTSREAGATTPP